MLPVLAGTAGAESLVASGGNSYSPYHYVIDGQDVGFDVDLLEAVARTMGLDLTVQLGPWNEARDGLRDGSVQIHVGMTISPERQEQYRFASPHLSQNYKIFVRSDASGIGKEEDLSGKRLIVQREGVMDRYVVSRQYTSEPIRAANAQEALRMLAAGEGDACLMSELRGLHVLRELGLENIERVGEPVHQTYYAFAVIPTYEHLVPQLNRGLAILKASGEYDAIYDKWFGVLGPPSLSTWDYLVYVSWVIVPLTLAFLLASLWSWMLRRQVLQQTDELRDARDQAEAASEAKSRFLATMSHEIRTPLNGVLGMSQILMTSDLNADQSDQLETILKSAEALHEIITDILDFSRIEAGERELESIRFSPAELATDTLDILRPLADEKGIELKAGNLAELPPALFGDPTALRQVLLNLLGNAVKFTDDGFVSLNMGAIRLNETRSILKVEIEDTGVGLPADEISRLFEAFTQADSSTTRRFGGTGLGLAICRNLVDMMGGSLSFRAREDGGSVFQFEVELGADLMSVKTKTPDVTAGESIAWDPDGLHVLLVEDNPLNQRVMSFMFKKFGIKMTLASNGQEALSICDNNYFDAILMDCQMPVMDGLEATAELRRREGGLRRTPIIALTAGAFESDRDRCLAAGMDDYLTKPVDGELLLQVLQKWVALQTN